MGLRQTSDTLIQGGAPPIPEGVPGVQPELEPELEPQMLPQWTSANHGAHPVQIPNSEAVQQPKHGDDMAQVTVRMLEQVGVSTA